MKRAANHHLQDKLSEGVFEMRSRVGPEGLGRKKLSMDPIDWWKRMKIEIQSFC